MFIPSICWFWEGSQSLLQNISPFEFIAEMALTLSTISAMNSGEKFSNSDCDPSHNQQMEGMNIVMKIFQTNLSYRVA